MTGEKSRTVQDLAAIVGGTVIGNPDTPIRRIASLADAASDDIAYVEDPRFFETASNSGAGCVLVPLDSTVTAPCRIAVRRPKLAFVRIGEVLHPADPVPAGVHPTAVVDERADLGAGVSVGPHAVVGASRVGPDTRIGAGAFVGNDVTIGGSCVVYPRVVIYDRVTIGSRVILHAGACIGADGFGFVRDGNTHLKFPQTGTVVLEDDVELGAGVCVDRGALGATRIGQGTKLDNLVHVGHNADIGRRVVIAAQTGISGSVVIEDDVVVGGQVGFGDHVRVKRGAMIGSKAGVLPGKILRPGQWWGVPVQRLRAYKRLNAHWHRLPRLRIEMRDLRGRLEAMQAWIDRHTPKDS